MRPWRHPFESAPYASVACATPAQLERLLDARDERLVRSLRPETAAAWIVTGGSALLSIALYTDVWGLPIALGLVLGMWAHELGHLGVLRALGIASAPIVFVPFIGATQTLHARPTSTRDAVHLALAGPACGLAFAGACLLAHALTGDPDLRFVGYAHVVLALVDLLPIGPLDGARALAALSARRV